MLLDDRGCQADLTAHHYPTLCQPVSGVDLLDAVGQFLILGGDIGDDPGHGLAGLCSPAEDFGSLGSITINCALFFHSPYFHEFMEKWSPTPPACGKSTLKGRRIDGESLDKGPPAAIFYLHDRWSRPNTMSIISHLGGRRGEEVKRTRLPSSFDRRTA